MNPMITNAEKKTFVEWFLKEFELQKRECAWLLTYLMSDERLLGKVHFVDDMSDVHRSIVMSTKCVREVSFQFKKRRMISTDVEKAFHDIRLNPDEDIYVKLVFSEYEICPEYAAVREVGYLEKSDISTNNLYSLLAEMVLDEVIERFEKERLYEQIDQSLVEYDKESFMNLSKRLVELNEDDC